MLKVIISRIKVKMTVRKSYISLICPDNIKHLSFTVSKPRARQDFQANESRSKGQNNQWQVDMP